MEEDYTDILFQHHLMTSNGNTNIPSHGNTSINIKKISKYEWGHISTETPRVRIGPERTGTAFRFFF